MKMTLNVARVLREFLDDPGVVRYGAGLCADLDMPSGSVFPLLARLEAAGLIAGEWEKVDPREQERPARRYYRLTGPGLAYAVRELEALASGLRPPPRALRALAAPGR